jgi:hypothetical protein
LFYCVCIKMLVHLQICRMFTCYGSHTNVGHTTDSCLSMRRCLDAHVCPGFTDDLIMTAALIKDLDTPASMARRCELFEAALVNAFCLHSSLIIFQFHRLTVSCHQVFDRCCSSIHPLHDSVVACRRLHSDLRYYCTQSNVCPLSTEVQNTCRRRRRRRSQQRRRLERSQHFDCGSR